MIGDTPTTPAEVLRSASRTPGTDSTVPTETTGFDGANSTASAPAMASATPGPGVASSAPTGTIECAGSSARYRTHHSWKCSALRWSGFSGSSTTTWVSTRSSDIGSNLTPGRQRSHSASVTADSGYPARSI